MSSHLVPSRSKISSARKEEIVTVLESLGLDSTGLKPKLEIRLYEYLGSNLDLGNNKQYKQFFSSHRTALSASASDSRSASKSPEDTRDASVVSNSSQINEDGSFVDNPQYSFTTKAIEPSSDAEKDTQIGQSEGSEEEEQEEGQYDGEIDIEDQEEEEANVLHKSISMAMENFESVDEKARQVSKKWSKVIKKQSKKALKQSCFIWSKLVEWVSTTRLSLSKLSVINGLFLFMELFLLLLPLTSYQKSSNLRDAESIIHDFETDKETNSLVESSSALSLPIFQSVSTFFSNISTSNVNSVLVWFAFFLVGPVLVSFFFNLSTNYYTKKDQEVHHQLSLQAQKNQSVSRRTRSHTSGAASHNNNILVDFAEDDTNGSESEGDFKAIVESPFVIDPLVFALARFAMVYFLYSISASSSSSSSSDASVSASVVASSHAIKSGLGNLPYLHSIFSALLALYVVSL